MLDKKFRIVKPVRKIESQFIGRLLYIVQGPFEHVRQRTNTRSAVFFVPNKGIIVISPHVLGIADVTSVSLAASTIVQKYPCGRTRAIQRLIHFVKSVLWWAAGFFVVGVPVK